MAETAIDSLHSLDLNRLYKIYHTVHEMMLDRGYEPVEPWLKKKQWISKFLGLLAEAEDDTSDIDAFGVVDSLSLLFTKDKEQTFIYFHPLDTKLCQTDMSYIRTLMNEKGAQSLILVVNNKVTPKVSNVLEILGNEAQLFCEEELLFNVTHHQLVPKHRLLTGEEREQILNLYAKLPDGKHHLELIPGIFSNDAVSKYYNFKVDDLICIERLRPDGFYDLTYRVVIYPITDKDKNKKEKTKKVQENK